MTYKFKARTTDDKVVLFSLWQGLPVNIIPSSIGIFTGYTGYLGEELYLHDKVYYFPKRIESVIIFDKGCFCLEAYKGMSWYLNNCKLI